jgi:FRG domain
MVLAQHFGLPTRILDWTENPLVALYFSVGENSEFHHDGTLYSYHHGTREIDIESLSDPFVIKQTELVRPPHLDQRIIAQQSVFTAEPPHLTKGGRQKSDLRYWYVSANHKKDLRIELKKLGISESSLFPGLASLAAEIKNEIALPALSIGFAGSTR